MSLVDEVKKKLFRANTGDYDLLILR